MQLIHSEFYISWVLTNVDSPSLKCPLPHFCIEGKEAKVGVPGKAAIFIHQHMFKVVADSDLIAALSKKISSSHGKQAGECHAEISLSGELMDGSAANNGPREC